jgi:hypothetical protein
MVTLPVRAALARDDRVATKTLLSSIVFASAVVAFFLMYLSPWNQPWAYRLAYLPHDNASNAFVQVGMARVIVTTALYVAPLLWAARRWQLPFGTATIAFTAISFAQSGLEGFDVRLTILAATVGGLVFDLLLRDRRPLHLVGAVSAVAMWFAFFGLYDLEAAVRWGPSLWVGAVFFGGVTGLASGVAVRER